MTSTADFFIAIHDRVQAVKATVDPDQSYDVIGIAEDIMRDGLSLSQVGEQSFLRLMTLHMMQDRTELPCPHWCRYAPGHRFEGSYENGRQWRFHSLELDAPDDVSVTLTQEEQREAGDDSTIERHRPVVNVEADADFQAGALRQFAATLLNAADALGQVSE